MVAAVVVDTMRVRVVAVVLVDIPEALGLIIIPVAVDALISLVLVILIPVAV
jgi:hypothetical protein